MNMGIAPELLQIEQSLTAIVRRSTIRRFHDRVARDAGVEVDRARYHVLRYVGGHGPLRVSELAAGLGVEPPTVTRHVQRLVRRGWLARSPHPDDGRVAVVSVAPDGTAIIAKLEAARRSVLAEILGGWARGDLETLAENLQRFSHDFTTYVEDSPEDM